MNENNLQVPYNAGNSGPCANLLPSREGPQAGFNKMLSVKRAKLTESLTIQVTELF